MLPPTGDPLRPLRVTEHDALAMGGEAVLLAASSLDEGRGAKVVAHFEANWDDHYREFLGKCAGLEAEIAREIAEEKFTFAEMEEDGDLRKLQGWLAKLEGRLGRSGQRDGGPAGARDRRGG